MLSNTTQILKQASFSVGKLSMTFPVFANNWMIIMISYVFYIFLFNL